MRIRVLGARQGESAMSHFGSLLIDGVIALDAGSLSSQLSLEEQLRIRHVVLTHEHYDHVKDLSTVGFNFLYRSSFNLWCTEQARDAIAATLFNERIWMDMFSRPTPEQPAIIFHPVKEREPFEVEGYRFLGLPLPHGIPVLGYEITAPSGGKLLYTGDNGPGAGAVWAEARPDLMITEVTFADSRANVATLVGHLTPQLLDTELEVFRSRQGYVPRVIAVHVNPFEEAQVARELRALSEKLGVSIEVAKEGMNIDL